MIWIRILIVEVIFWFVLAVGSTVKLQDTRAERDELAEALLEFRARMATIEERFDGALEDAELERERMRPEYYGREWEVAGNQAGAATSHLGGPSE